MPVCGMVAFPERNMSLRVNVSRNSYKAGWESSTGGKGKLAMSGRAPLTIL